jgi:hypothetical protein
MKVCNLNIIFYVMIFICTLSVNAVFWIVLVIYHSKVHSNKLGKQEKFKRTIVRTYVSHVQSKKVFGNSLRNGARYIQ